MNATAIARWRRGCLRGSLPVAGTGAPTVLKLGGSLLCRPGWPEIVAGLIADHAADAIVVTGGGPVVDGLRAIDAAAPRPPALMHRLAIEALAITARLVAMTLDVALVAEPGRSKGVRVLDVPTWLAVGGRAALPPEGWHVTSDSIAALVAAACAGPLVLAKSVPPPCPGPHLAPPRPDPPPLGTPRHTRRLRPTRGGPDRARAVLGNLSGVRSRTLETGGRPRSGPGGSACTDGCSVWRTSRSSPNLPITWT